MRMILEVTEGLNKVNKVVKQMEKSEQPKLLSLDGSDSDVAIERYNETARKNADSIILNILNNLTVS